MAEIAMLEMLLTLILSMMGLTSENINLSRWIEFLVNYKLLDCTGSD